METHKWIPAAGGAVAVVVIVQIVLTVGLWRSASRTAERVALLEKEVEVAAKAASALEEAREDLDRLEAELDEVKASGLYSSGKIKKLDSKVEDMSDIEAGLSSMFPEIEALIDKKVREGMGKKGEGRKGLFTSMSEIADDLSLNQYQKQKTAEIFNAAKYEAFQVVTVPREDGTSILDEFSEAILKSDNPRKEGMKVLFKLAVEDVPGTSETYFSRLTRIRKEAVKDAGSAMTAEQLASLESMKVNVYGVDTGYNPLTEYFRTVMAGGE